MYANHFLLVKDCTEDVMYYTVGTCMSFQETDGLVMVHEVCQRISWKQTSRELLATHLPRNCSFSTFAAAQFDLQSFPAAQLDLVLLLRKSLLNEEVGLMTYRRCLGASYSFVQGWLSLASVRELAALK